MVFDNFIFLSYFFLLKNFFFYFGVAGETITPEKKLLVMKKKMKMKMKMKIIKIKVKKQTFSAFLLLFVFLSFIHGCFYKSSSH